MAQVITYTAKQRKEWYDAGWNGRGSEMGFRALKMVRPQCKPCQSNPEHLPDWFETCPHKGEDGSAIYWSFQPKIVKTEVYKTDEDGDVVLDEEASKAQSKTKMIRMPNVTQIACDLGHDSGNAVNKVTALGFKQLPELNIAPICEWYGCGKSYPTIRTNLGDYCTEFHAKLAVAVDEEIILGLPNSRRRREQIRDIGI